MLRMWHVVLVCIQYYIMFMFNVTKLLLMMLLLLFIVLSTHKTDPQTLKMAGDFELTKSNNYYIEDGFLNCRLTEVLLPPIGIFN